MRAWPYLQRATQIDEELGARRKDCGLDDPFWLWDEEHRALAEVAFGSSSRFYLCKPLVLLCFGLQAATGST